MKSLVMLGSSMIAVSACAESISGPVIVVDGGTLEVRVLKVAYLGWTPRIETNMRDSRTYWDRNEESARQLREFAVPAAYIASAKRKPLAWDLKVQQADGRTHGWQRCSANTAWPSLRMK